MRRAPAYLVLAVSLAACSGGGGGIALADLQTKSLDARCSFLVRCGLFADADSCHKFFIITDDPSAQAAVDMHKSNYDGGNAKACLDAIAAASCDQTQQDSREQPEPCKHIFTGTGAMGDACAFDAECSSNNCVIPTTATGACPQGMCGAEVPLAKVGESCNMVDCEPGLFCNAQTTCANLVASGGACDFSSDCDYGLGCVGATGAATCKALPLIGSACPDMQCAEIGANCNAQMTCVALGLPGDPCMGDGDCTFFGHCDTTMSKCADFPTRGMPCDSICSDDSWCQIPMGMTMGTCAAPQANGATCTGNDQCTTHFCNGSPGTCADPAVCI
jgi:hypothetical protein